MTSRPSPDTPHSDLWLRRFHPTSQATNHLVCFPHAGGAASFFFPVSRALSPAADVLAVQYPGRQDRRREPCLDTVAALADGAVEALLPVLDRPVALFGHSLGASVAFEVALRLERRSITPVTLFVSGRRAPSLPTAETVHLRDDRALTAEIGALSGTESWILDDPELMESVLPALRSDFRAAETYRWSGDGPLRAPIHTHIGDADPKASPDDAAAWSDHTSGAFSLTTHPGDHFYLVPRAAELIGAIERVLVAGPGTPTPAGREAS